MCSLNRNTVKFSGKYVRSTGTSADNGSSCTECSGIWSLCTTKTKFHDTAASSIVNTRSLCCDETLVVDNI